MKKNKSEIDVTPTPNQETFENLLKDFANELLFFYFLFPADILNDTVYQTILYSTQEQPEKPSSIMLDNIEKFIACALYMSVIKLPSTRDYWSSKLSVSCDLMGVNRFKEIKRFMHFNDNSVENVDDKLHKLRPVIDNISELLRLVPIEECLAVDEQIIPFKGKSSLKQYNPKKPHKWGYKVFVLSGVSGFNYNFEIFTGKSDNICAPDEPDMGASSNVVVRLARIIPNFCNYKLYIDNWFNSIPQQIFMYEHRFLLLGTVRSNRLRQCQLPPEKEMKREGRGSFLEKVATIDGVTLSVVSWYDSKIVTVLSNFVDSEPVTEVKRFSKAMKETKSNVPI